VEDPVELDSGGCCEDDQMRAGAQSSQQRGSKILGGEQDPLV
jgi:hypothetical protein